MIKLRKAKKTKRVYENLWNTIKTATLYESIKIPSINIEVPTTMVSRVVKAVQKEKYMDLEFKRLYVGELISTKKLKENSELTTIVTFQLNISKRICPEED